MVGKVAQWKEKGKGIRAITKISNLGNRQPQLAESFEKVSVFIILITFIGFITLSECGK